jgi:uncharacterized protein (DUF427 family)
LYFPETGFVDRTKFTESDTHTHCGWKGMSHPIRCQYCCYQIGEKLIRGDASYYNFKDADGKEYKDVAWYVLLPHFLAELRWN